LRRCNIIAPFGTTRKAARERVSVLWYRSPLFSLDETTLSVRTSGGRRSRFHRVRAERRRNVSDQCDVIPNPSAAASQNIELKLQG
jgi:hypothetical protein